ncbi:MAG TPA: hypothetical protein PLH91_00495 [Tenuifilaceae bacterium]|nr:hypothetical protein [Tenuifilaceae bacterium]
MLLNLLNSNAMKNILFLAFVALLFSACDDRDDYFAENNAAPTLKILVNGLEVFGEFSDTIKLGHFYPVKCVFSDDKDENLTPFLASSSLNYFAFAYNEVSKTLLLDGKAEGMATATICVKDSYGKETKKSLVFTFIENLPPVARVSVEVVGSSGSKEVQVNATGSYDKDARLGGSIVLYEYNLDGYSFTTPSGFISYIFPTTGVKNIAVRVKDNNNVWSGWASKSVGL